MLDYILPAWGLNMVGLRLSVALFQLFCKGR